MPQFISGETRKQGISDIAKVPVKCRIPLRLPAGRRKTINPKTKARNISKYTKPKSDFVTMQQPRLGMSSGVTQPRSNDPRPRSASQSKDNAPQVKPPPPSYLGRNERERPILKRPSTIPKLIPPNKSIRPVIVVPMTQKQAGKGACNTRPSSGLPTQELITKSENQELHKNMLSDTTQVSSQGDSAVPLRSGNVSKIKNDWQEKLVQFEKMKYDLSDRQKALMEVYVFLRNTHHKLTMLGQKVYLPPAEDLRIMNVAKLTPEQLLHLCTGANNKSDDRAKGPVSIDINKLYNMPSKLVAACEHTLIKRKEIIDWFDTLRNHEKGIRINTLSKKINEFNTENELMKNSLDQVKGEFFKELNEIIEFIRKSVTETEELHYALTDLDAQNTDLRKKVNHSEHLRCQLTKGKLEELEKELKEERCKKMIMKEKLTRAEGQIKINAEKASQLEAALEQARSQTWNLERTVQQLVEQNKKLQDDFDKEFTKLTESIKENTVHLEEIADAREKLQLEKEDLEKRLSELSEYYNMSLKNKDLANVAKLVEIEKKYDQEREEKSLLESKVESLCAQLLTTQLDIRDLKKRLDEKNMEINKAKAAQTELEALKLQLDTANTAIEEFEKRLTKQNETIEEMECNLKESKNQEESLKTTLSSKDNHISELEEKQSLLEQKLQDSEKKMASYIEQLSSLKNHINQLQEDFGRFDNLKDLREMIIQQRAKLLETTRQNGELAEALQKKDLELEQHLENLAEQESLLEQREGVIKMLTEKDEEQGNIIKLLRNNLEMRAQADSDLNQQIMEKNIEIDSLITNVETRKQTISQMENVILTLEDQTRKASQQRRKDLDQIRLLEEKLVEYETINMEYQRSVHGSSGNLDNFIKILEDELGTGIDTQQPTEQEYIASRQRFAGDHKHDKPHRYERDNIEIKTQYSKDPNNMSISTRVALEKFGKTPISSHAEHYQGDNLDRKRGIMNIDTQKLNSIPGTDFSVYASNPETLDILSKPTVKTQAAPVKDNTFRNLPLLISQQLRDDKKHKMFKFAGHRL